MITVLVVDEQQLLRRGLRLLLGTEPGLEVVGEAADGREALAMVERFRPDVVLTDARMPGMDGLDPSSTRRPDFSAPQEWECHREPGDAGPRGDFWSIESLTTTMTMTVTASVDDPLRTSVTEKAHLERIATQSCCSWAADSWVVTMCAADGSMPRALSQASAPAVGADRITLISAPIR